MAMVVTGDMCVQSITAIHTIIMLVIVLRLSAVVIYFCHGDGSDGRHVCSSYYQELTVEIVSNLVLLRSVYRLLPFICSNLLRYFPFSRHTHCEEPETRFAGYYGSQARSDHREKANQG